MHGDGLSSIEISLMELEENPDDMNIIDSIFRPFHTIKGVSGFVNLNNINKLAHRAESLLDKARSKEIIIQNKIIDIILEAFSLKILTKFTIHNYKRNNFAAILK